MKRKMVGPNWYQYEYAFDEGAMELELAQMRNHEELQQEGQQMNINLSEDEFMARVIQKEEELRNQECVICLYPLKDKLEGNQVITDCNSTFFKTQCNHCFHKECMLKMFAQRQ